MSNKKIIELFEKLIIQTEEICYDLKQKGDKKEANTCQFKITNYKKGLNILKSFKNEIKSVDELKGIPGIGKGIISRIEEILMTGNLAELKSNTESDKKQYDIDELQLITGVGPKSAHKIYDDGFTLKSLLDQLKQISGNNNIQDLTIEDIIYKSIQKNLYLHTLTHHQIIGLKYFDDINERIPREELTKIETKLKNKIKKIDPKLIITICGSYRRKLPTSGDIDVLITHPDLETEEDVEEEGKQYLSNIIDKLTKSKLLIDDLTKLGTTKYMGICKLSDKHKGRRIDIRFVSRNNYAPALLYFTGSKNFNQKIRGDALRKGYTINEYGIYKLQVNRGKYIHKKGAKILVKTEKDIFDLVGMEYLEPENRT